MATSTNLTSEISVSSVYLIRDPESKFSYVSRNYYNINMTFFRF